MVSEYPQRPDWYSHDRGHARRFAFSVLQRLKRPVAADPVELVVWKHASVVRLVGDVVGNAPALSMARPRSCPHDPQDACWPKGPVHKSTGFSRFAISSHQGHDRQSALG